MSNPFDTLTDDLDAVPAQGPEMVSVAKAQAGPEFIEVCPKCRGGGQFISYSGRVLGPCFACKGKGKNVYKSSPEARAKGRERAANKATAREQEIKDNATAWIEAHPAEAKWLADAGKRNAERGGTFTFPADVLNKLWQWGTLTDGQLAAVQKMMARDATRAAERVAAAPAIDATKIEEAFKVAVDRAKRKGQKGVFKKPLKLTSSDELGKITLAFRPGSEGSQWADMLFVKSVDDRKLGYIKGGKLFRKFDCTDAEAAAITAVAQDPETAVVAFAKAWSRCGICHQTLLNDVSIARGIGPVCASKFGFAL